MTFCCPNNFGKIYSVADFVLKADVTASQITLWKIDLETCFLPRDSSCTKTIWLCGNFKTFLVPLSPIHQTFFKKNILKAFLFFTHTHNDNVCKLSLGNSTVTYRRLNPYTLAGIRTRDLVLFAADAMTSIPRRHGRAIYQTFLLIKCQIKFMYIHGTTCMYTFGEKLNLNTVAFTITKLSL
jgi:hypothetical protein